MDRLPAVLAVVLEAGDVGAEEWRELASTSGSLALVTHLVIEHVRFHLHLSRNEYDNALPNRESIETIRSWLRIYLVNTKLKVVN